MAQAAAVSLRQSLTQGLASYDYLGPRHAPHDGGPLAHSTLAPILGIRRNHAGLRFVRGQQCLTIHLSRSVTAAQQHLNQLRSQSQALQQPNAQLQRQIDAMEDAVRCALNFQQNRRFIPDREGNIMHHNEADVVRTACLYLIHPFAEALWACPSYHQTFQSQAEDVSGISLAQISFSTGLTRRVGVHAL